ncbi:SpoVA/SpoVAEb family sporulation membrane protein [Alkalicoccobacillus gibsonii]|jgi:stage V sporulation protein AE|uniref:SpoVA/SpoVAEb family sporulation membrane protein n=1 Tax=Alkalicoccobacillus gibsonii TaxID=79881 RepID=UPI0019338174|nr:SpoVA/SpoVAEb family sporulation membrane protein [Alkalicoccobacillus gibsonii]MBM0064548.1 SpoVA/SpoVAEb family sporulation membrane protein [Alkalicoccobacillus gibsonii]
MDYLLAFLVGGCICFIGQCLLVLTRATPVQCLVILVILGACLDGFHLYDSLLEISEAGAIIPVTSIGHALVHGAMSEGGGHGFLGIGAGLFTLASTSISVSIVISFGVALLCKPRG